jgi:hypothetical protein
VGIYGLPAPRERADLPRGEAEHGTAPAVSRVRVDGNVQPIFCNDGGVNMKAWHYFAGVRPVLLGLGPNASHVDVRQAAWSHPGPIRITASAEQLATRYYGWNFATDPLGEDGSFLANGGCSGSQP